MPRARHAASDKVEMRAGGAPFGLPSTVGSSDAVQQAEWGPRARSADVQTSVKNPILIRERLAALASASVDVFASKGYHASRVSDIVKLAGISQGTAYNYVRSKEDLLYLVCHEYLTGFQTIVTRALEDAFSPREKLLKLIWATVRVTRDYRYHHLVLQRELHCLDRRSRTPFLRDAAKFRGICEDVLVEVRKDGDLPIAHPRLAANILIHLPSVFVMRGWDLGRDLTDEQIDAELVTFMLNGLGLQPLAGEPLD